MNSTKEISKYDKKETSMNLIDKILEILKKIFILIDDSNEYEINEDLKYCFKVLIYDDKVFNILYPLLKVFFLREYNIALTLNIKDQRDKIPDIMAIYIVSNTEENLNIIYNDMTNKIFDNFSINFLLYDTSNSVDINRIQNFYQKISILDNVNSIYNISIYPIDLSIYHSNVFSLNIKRPYYYLNAPNIPDEKYTEYLSNLSNGLFSCLYLLKTIPIIKYRTGFFAEDITKKIQNHFKYLFDKFPEEKESFKIKKNQRTLLILLDRDTDLPIMLHHAAGLGSMIMDSFGINRGDDIEKNKDKKKFDIDLINDYIWNENINELFYEVGEKTLKQLKDFYNDMNYLDKVHKPKNIEQLEEESKKISESIDTLRDKKIKSEILQQQSDFNVKLSEYASKRNLGQLYENESQILKKRNNLTNSIKDKFYDNFKKLKNEYNEYDFYRTALIYYLCDSNITENESNELSNLLPNKNAFNYLKKRKNEAKSNKNNKKSYLDPKWISAFMNLLNIEQPSISADLINNLVSNKQVEKFETYNLYKKCIERENIDYEYTDVIVFFIGGGCFGEYEYIEDLMKKSGKNIIYGCDYLYNAEEFINDLEDLGKN